MSLVQLARAWIVVATQSFGGGPASLLLARRELVEKHGWLTQRQFLEDYALSKMGLGINLITMSGLIGARIAGRAGAAVSVASFILPSAAITVALTAGYLLVRDNPVVQAALAGAGPIAAGMTAGFAFNLARGSVRRGRRSAIDFAFGLAVFVAGFAYNVSPLVLIPVGVGVGALALRGESSRASGEAAA